MEKETKNTLFSIVVILFLIFILTAFLLFSEKAYPATTGELSLMSCGNVSECYTKWSNYSKYIDWSTSYNKIFADIPIKDEVVFGLNVYLPYNLFIPITYTQDFVPQNIETMAGIGWERVLKQNIWNLDIGVGALWNNVANGVFCDIFIKNITQFKFYGIFKLTNTLRADIPIGEQFRLNTTTKLSINIVDFTGITNFKTALELTNIEELKNDCSSTNRIGLSMGW